MSRLLASIHDIASCDSERIAFESGYPAEAISYATLSASVRSLSELLARHDLDAVALMADNCAVWAIMDLGALEAGLPVTPLPHFFSDHQIEHLFLQCGIHAVLSDSPDQVKQICETLHLGYVESDHLVVGEEHIYLFQLTVSKSVMADRSAKLTFTSGSTGDPKGVRLNLEVMESVALSLVEVTGARADDRHLSLLPYATLLENIGGLYAPLMVGATVCAPGLTAVGLSGASGLDVQRFIGMLCASRATTCIMIPQMLHALVAAVEAGAAKPETLRYIAVGGAPVSPHLLSRAAAVGLPVYEGYGLSEAASVVAVNTPSAHRLGSVGKVLPHARVSIADDGEILVEGALFEGYLGEPAFTGQYWPSGDIGYLDDDGYLYLTGRKKHIFITTFGRNVSPEWVERELSIESAIGQCCLFGEARPFNVAVIVPRSGMTADAIALAVSEANKRLPDYAQVSRWLISEQPFSVDEGLWTGTGRPRRNQIYKRFQQELDALYEES